MQTFIQNVERCADKDSGMIQIVIGLATLLISVSIAASLYTQSEQTKTSVNTRILRQIAIEERLDEVEAFARSEFQSLRSFQERLTEVAGRPIRANASTPRRILSPTEFSAVFQRSGQALNREPEFEIHGTRFRMTIQVALETLPDVAVFPVSADGTYHQLRLRSQINDLTNRKSYPEVIRVLSWW